MTLSLHNRICRNFFYGPRSRHNLHSLSIVIVPIPVAYHSYLRKQPSLELRWVPAKTLFQENYQSMVFACLEEKKILTHKMLYQSSPNISDTYDFHNYVSVSKANLIVGDAKFLCYKGTLPTVVLQCLM